MALKASSSCHQGLTPPDSPVKESPATLEDLKHLFGVFLKSMLLDVTSGEPRNTPVSQDRSPDMVRLKKMLVKLTRDECALAELSVAFKSTQSGPASNEQEGVQIADENDLNSPICTTPNDFKSFEKWASASQYKTIVETYEPPILLLISF